MNYIAKLRDELAHQTAVCNAMAEALDEFRVYLLTSPKFGNRWIYDQDGLPVVAATHDRLDWISVSEAVGRLDVIRDIGKE